MLSTKHTFSTLILIIIGFAAHASGLDSVRYDVQLSALTSNGKYAPFWFQSNQYGKISQYPSSTNLLIGVSKDYNSNNKVFDYGFRLSANSFVDTKSSNLYLHEYYGKFRVLFLDFSAGAKEEQYGNQDSTLSSGGFLLSQNARPIPKIHVGIDRFTTIPFTFGLLQIKGGISHGWFTDNVYGSGIKYHHKFLYGKIGGNLPVHFQYGVDHAAEWGGTVPGYGSQPSGFKDFITIFFGHSGGTAGESINALGNHIISQSMKLDGKIGQYELAAYWQNLSEDGPIRFITKTMNVPDGLWGISIRNKHFPVIKGIVYEYLNTTDQSGPYHDKDGIVFGGSDSYFTNYVYGQGWTNYSRTIGTPFITSPIYSNNVYITNNRVQLHHFGIEGAVKDYSFKGYASISKNYGSYGEPRFANQQSYLIQVNKTFANYHHIEVAASFALDHGSLLGNSTGFMMTIKKAGNLFKY